MSPPDRSPLTPAQEQGVHRYFAAFLSPTVVGAATGELETTVAGWDAVSPVELFRAAHDVLERHVAVAEDIEAIVLADDVGLAVADVASVLDIDQATVREILIEEGIDVDEVPAWPDAESEPEPEPGAGREHAREPEPTREPEPAPAEAMAPAPSDQVEDRAVDPGRAHEPADEPGASPRVSRARRGATPTEGATRRTATPMAITGLVLAAVVLGLVVVTIARGGAGGGCAADAPIEVAETRMTDFVDLPGDPGPDRGSFAEDERVKLWMSYERRTDDPVELTVVWFRGDTALYSTDFRLPGSNTTNVNLTLVELFQEVGDDYRVEIRDGDCTLVTEGFSIEGA